MYSRRILLHDNALDAAVANYQKLNTTVGESSIFPRFQVNTTVASTTQDITNQLTQVMNNLCNGAVSNAQIGQIIYATDSTLQNISLCKWKCTGWLCHGNTARLQLQNQQVGDLTAKSGSQNSLIAAIVAAVVILIVIVVVSRVLKKNTSEKQMKQKLNRQ